LSFKNEQIAACPNSITFNMSYSQLIRNFYKTTKCTPEKVGGIFFSFKWTIQKHTQHGTQDTEQR